jgi:hypothetical protein
VDPLENTYLVTEKQFIEFVFEDINTEDKVDRLVVPQEITDLQKYYLQLSRNKHNIQRNIVVTNPHPKFTQILQPNMLVLSQRIASASNLPSPPNVVINNNMARMEEVMDRVRASVNAAFELANSNVDPHIGTLNLAQFRNSVSIMRLFNLVFDKYKHHVSVILQGINPECLTYVYTVVYIDDINVRPALYFLDNAPVVTLWASMLILFMALFTFFSSI